MIKELCSLLMGTVASVLVADRLIPLAYQQRGYSAMGSEYFVIVLVGILVYGLMRCFLPNGYNGIYSLLQKGRGNCERISSNFKR